ncbi:hypothetical protein [Mycobacterium sp. C31M]
MQGVERWDARRKASSLRYGAGIVAVCAALVVAPVHGVAWADDTGSSSTAGTTSSDRSDTKTSESTDAKGAAGEPESPGRPDRDKPEPDTSEPDDTEPDDTEPDDTEPDDTDTDTAEDAAQETPDADDPDTERTDPDDEKPESKGPRSSAATPDRDELIVTRPSTRSVHTVRTATAPAAAGVIDIPTPQPQAAVTAAAVAPALTGAVGTAAVEVTTPTPPKPLAPIATILELPGRIVNAVLQFLDLTSAIGPRSPFNIAPINDLLFAAFRELERLVGLHKTPAVQPVLPTMIYTGPTDRPTPTVAQFLNASTAAYGWGTTPGGIVPLTDANGFQLQATNVFSGMSGKAWVTEQGQIIIAYQGTTGGTNLLVNPLITLTQLAADMQVILTGTTPLAFYDALRFARRVQEEAALQGYAAEDVFVTGHSLGGWEAQFVSQRTGLAGIGFEGPGLNTKVPGNGADTNFVNIVQYGSPAAFMATDLPGLQPFMPPYVPGGGSKPHYGPIVVIGDREAMNPLVNASAMFGKSLIGSLVFAIDFLGNFFQYHLMGVQAYHLDVDPDPGVVPWLGTRQGTVHTGYGELTIQQLLAAASDDGILITP